MSTITFTTIETDHLNKICAQLDITLETATSRHANLQYGPLMARLIDQRQAASYEAKKNEPISDNQRISLKAHHALALHRGDTDLAADIKAVLRNFSATYGMAHLAMNIAIDEQGKPAASFYPKRENNAPSTRSNSSPAIDVSSVVMPEEAV